MVLSVNLNFDSFGLCVDIRCDEDMIGLFFFVFLLVVDCGRLVFGVVGDLDIVMGRERIGNVGYCKRIDCYVCMDKSVVIMFLYFIWCEILIDGVLVVYIGVDLFFGIVGICVLEVVVY